MTLADLASREIERIQEELLRRQSADGTWRFGAESGPTTDAYTIVLLQALGRKEGKLVSGLAERLLSLQQPDGAWRLYHDEAEGNLSATVEALFALLYSGAIRDSDIRVRKAKQYITRQGGLSRAGLMTKAMLAMNGQYPWRKPILLPLELLRLPSGSPIHFFQFSVYARAHLAPVLVAAHYRYVLRNDRAPDLSDLVFSRRKHLLGREQRPPAARKTRSRAIGEAERYMLERIEPDGTLCGYFSATFLMIYALLALGYAKDHPVVASAVRGVEQWIGRSDNGFPYVQNFTSTVWDTALIGHALLVSGIPASHPAIRSAGQYLLHRQHAGYGDWHIHNPAAEPGGWGFSDVNRKVPDIDDTQAALRVIHGLTEGASSAYAASWKRGLTWLLTMQNEDGGWAAFEKKAGSRLLSRLPFENARDALVDPSSADITGRVLEFLGNHVGVRRGVAFVDRAVSWLLRMQSEDGSWYGRWGICRIYGTWAALSGLAAVGVPRHHPAVRKAIRWLHGIQNADGGFGESCGSDSAGRYVPLGGSTPSQTAWAADALLSFADRITPEIEKAVSRLISFAGDDECRWPLRYPTGAGLPGGFYIRYHSYRWIWPLLALAKFRNLAAGPCSSKQTSGEPNTIP